MTSGLWRGAISGSFRAPFRPRDGATMSSAGGEARPPCPRRHRETSIFFARHSTPPRTKPRTPRATRWPIRGWVPVRSPQHVQPPGRQPRRNPRTSIRDGGLCLAHRGRQPRAVAVILLDVRVRSDGLSSRGRRSARRSRTGELVLRSIPGSVPEHQCCPVRGGVAGCPKGDKGCMYECNVVYGKCLKDCKK